MVQRTSTHRDPFTGRDSEESENIHITGIDVGGGWRTGCGSHPQSAELVEELEESVWSGVRQKNEHEHQMERVQDSGKTGIGVRAETWALKMVQENKLEDATMDVRSYEAVLNKK